MASTINAKVLKGVAIVNMMGIAGIAADDLNVVGYYTTNKHGILVFRFNLSGAFYETMPNYIEEIPAEHIATTESYTGKPYVRGYGGGSLGDYEDGPMTAYFRI